MKDKEKVRQYNAAYYRRNKSTLLPKLRARATKWCKDNKERRNQHERERRLKMGVSHPNISATRKNRKKLRDAALNVYGRACSCCKETIDEFLTIDHIRGGGTKHRSQIKSGGGVSIDG